MAATFHHAHIKSRNPRKSARWWADMFGASLLPEILFGGMLFAPVDVDGVRINITGHPPEEETRMAEPPAVPYFGLEHLGLLVDDLDGLVRRFEEQGLEVFERRPGAGGYEIAFATTPEGVCLELLQVPGGDA